MRLGIVVCLLILVPFATSATGVVPAGGVRHPRGRLCSSTASRSGSAVPTSSGSGSPATGLPTRRAALREPLRDRRRAGDREGDGRRASSAARRWATRSAASLSRARSRASSTGPRSSAIDYALRAARNRGIKIIPTIVGDDARGGGSGLRLPPLARDRRARLLADQHGAVLDRPDRDRRRRGAHQGPARPRERLHAASPTRTIRPSSAGTS